MKITNYKNEPVKENPHKIDARLIYNKESAEVVHLTLNAGESLKPHITPVDVFSFILEGKPTVHVGDEKQEVEKDVLVESPADIVHYISNESDETARIIVVKAPKPGRKTRVL